MFKKTVTLVPNRRHRGDLSRNEDLLGHPSSCAPAAINCAGPTPTAKLCVSEKQRRVGPARTSIPAFFPFPALELGLIPSPLHLFWTKWTYRAPGRFRKGMLWARKAELPGMWIRRSRTITWNQWKSWEHTDILSLWGRSFHTEAQVCRRHPHHSLCDRDLQTVQPPWPDDPMCKQVCSPISEIPKSKAIRKAEVYFSLSRQNLTWKEICVFICFTAEISICCPHWGYDSTHSIYCIYFPKSEASWTSKPSWLQGF